MARLHVLIAMTALLAACSKAPPAQDVPEAPVVWRPFTDDSPWNTPIPADAMSDADSAELMEGFAAAGSLFINIDQWSIPVYYIDMSNTPTQAVYDYYPGEYGRGFEVPREIPIPDDMATQKPSAGYIAIVDKNSALEWDLNQASKSDDGKWMTGFGVVSSLRGKGVYPAWKEAETPNEAASALPSGFPLVAGLIRVEEIKTGRIPHALMIASPTIRSDVFVRPASTARALQTYGAFVGDQAGANVLFAEAGPDELAQWPGLLKADDLAAVFSPEMMAKHFRVIDMGEALPAEPVPAQP